MRMMGEKLNTDWTARAASALDWWQLAGVDAMVAEQPRNWLAEHFAVPAQPTGDATPAPPAGTPLPDTLEAFEAWRTSNEAPEAGWGSPMLGAQGNAASGLVVMIEMPERDDFDHGILMSGMAGRLFDRMLAAIGRDRQSIYLVPLCVTLPTSGRVPAEAVTELARLARHHLALVAPKKVLVMGNAASRAILEADAARARGNLHTVKHNNGVSGAVASFHPRFLLERPAFKAEAWKDLQLLIEGFEG